MIMEGFEEIFVGYSGAATYLAVFCVIAAAVVFRELSRRENYGSSKIIAAVVLLSVSRFATLRLAGWQSQPLTAAAYCSGLMGFYYLVIAGLEIRSRQKLGIWNAKTVAAGTAAAAGAVVAFCWIVGREIAPAECVFLVGAFAHAGFYFSFWGKIGEGGCKSGVAAPLSLLFFAAAAMALGLKLSGFLTHSEIWNQLFALCDIGGLAFLAAMPSPEAGGALQYSEGEPSPEMSRRPEPRKLAEAGRVSVSEEPFSKKYRKICAMVKEEFEADFVVLSTLMDRDEEVRVRSCAGSCCEHLSPDFSQSHKWDRFDEYFKEEFREGGIFELDRSVLGADSAMFVPHSMVWETDSIYIYPVMDGPGISAYFTIGFVKEDAPPAGGAMEFYATVVAHLAREEKLQRDYNRKNAELAQSKQDLESANQMKSNFISVISHELRTPLTSVKAYVETLLQNVSSIKRETVEDFLKVMSEENERVIKLVDNILDYSTMETGQLNYRKDACDIVAIMSDVYNELERDILASKIDCDIQTPRSAVIMEVDNGLIRQLFFNLISNAIKFTPVGGNIKLAVEEEASAVRIMVQDTGDGIPEDQLERVFERFHQVDGSDTREHGGSGLGLAICKDIVEWHDGRIWVENIKEAGARFTVVLPVRDIVVRTSDTPGVVGITRFNREKFLTLLVEMLAGFLQARKASIMKLDEKENVLKVIAAKGMDAEFVQNTRVGVGERIAGRVFEEGRAVHIQDIERDSEFSRVNNSSYYGTRSFISVPLKEKDRILGVLNVSDHVDGKEFSGADREVLEALSGIILSMIKKLEAYEVVSGNFSGLREAMRSIVEFRESVGARNLSIYSRMAVETGKRLGLDEKSLAAVRIGMNIYDVGMMKIPRHIRGKKEKLEDSEWDELRKHPDIGYSLISPMGLDERIMKMIRSHHEDYSGGGYPEGRAVSKSGVAPGIIQVVDSFRALISPGPYKRQAAPEEAVEEILALGGEKFDPRIAEEFKKVFEEFRESGEIEEFETRNGMEIASLKKTDEGLKYAEVEEKV